MKSEILHLLRNADGYISGQQLCEAFGVSRTAVWKAINQLKEEGYVIDSVQNKGYRITEYPDIITDTEIRSLLIKDSAIKSRADKEQDREAGNKDRNVSTDKESYNKLKDNSSDDNKLEGIFQHIRYFEKTDSTNNQAKLAAESNAPDGTLFVAECQTGGRGRRGRSWESPAGTGIWMSLLLRPDMSPESASMLTLVLAIAMVEAIREEVKDIDCHIKWPNDIVVNGKKITGILTEMSAEMDLIHYVVIGIGINVNTTEFDEAIRDMATSLYLETHRKIKRSNIIAAFSRSFDKYYHEFLKTNDLSLLVDKYNELLINKDRTVRAIYEKEELIATAIGINKEGELIVKDEAGKEIAIRAGEVSVREDYMDMYSDENVVLCASNSYEKKYYFNPDFDRLPEDIKNELKIMCVLFTEEVGGILDMEFDEEGNLLFKSTADEEDLLYDDIACGLLVKKNQYEKRDLLESLEMFYKVFFLGLDE